MDISHSLMKIDSDQLSWFVEPLNREGSDKRKCQDALSY